MKVVDSNAMEWALLKQPRGGRAERKVLVGGELSPGIDFLMYMIRYGSGDDAVASPRHHHNFEQIRYAVEKPINYAEGKEVPEGWLAFFPAGAWYGPQLVDGGIQLLMQFGPGYLGPEASLRAQEELAEKGVFKDGMYSWTDSSGERHEQESMQALYEQAMGKPLEFPEPRYPEPVLINPNAFAWERNGGSVQHKHLATFNEQPFTIEMLRWQDSATYTLDQHRTQIVYSLGEPVSVGDEHAGAGAVVWSQPGEALSVEGVQGSELLVCEL